MYMQFSSNDVLWFPSNKHSLLRATLPCVVVRYLTDGLLVLLQ